MDGEMRTCENCRCAAPIDGEGGSYLECRRHAVSVAGLNDDGEVCSSFPATNPWDWCYEWVEGVPSWAGEGE